MTTDDTPSHGLPHDGFADPEATHSAEDGALWAFVHYVLNNVDEPALLRHQARVFIAWDDQHADRTRWFA